MCGKDAMYNVVFRNGDETSGYYGVITWTSFQSKEDFGQWYEKLSPEVKTSNQVVEGGVTRERAIELVEMTPYVSYLVAAVSEAIMPDGKVNRGILRMQLAKLELVKTLTAQEQQRRQGLEERT